jgi:hypothetical protein
LHASAEPAAAPRTEPARKDDEPGTVHPHESLILGLDIASVGDWSFLAGLLKTPTWHEGTQRYLNHYTVGLLERWRGIEFEDLIAMIGDLVARLPKRPELVVDGTGMGRPIVNMIRRSQMAIEKLIGVVITSGQREKEKEQGFRSVPKSTLVTNLEVLMNGRIKVAPSLPLARQLTLEMQHFARTRRDTGYESIESDTPRVPDDACIAVSLAAWWGERGQRQLCMNTQFGQE